MVVSLFRIDERLIHGQVMAVWLGKVGANTVIIVDDSAAKDEFMQQVYRLAAPAGVAVDVVDVATFREMMNAPGNAKAIILFKGPKEAFAALSEDVPVGELIIGNVSAAPERRKITRYAYMSNEEMELLTDLQEKGWSISTQLLPDESKTPFKM